MIALAVVSVLLLGVAAIFAIRMLRRDEPMSGLVALLLCLIASIPAVIYAGLDSG